MLAKKFEDAPMFMEVQSLAQYPGGVHFKTV